MSTFEQFLHKNRG